MASSPRPANLNLSGGVKDLQVTNQHRSPTYLLTHALKESSRLPILWWGVFHCTLTTYASSMLHKQTTNAMQCQEDPGSQALMASPSQNWRHTRQCTPCTQNIQSSVQGKTEFQIAL